jgi:HD-like signal output (HDOD) protein
METRRILIVDDQKQGRRNLEKALNSFNGEWVPEFSQTGEQALKSIRQTNFDIALCETTLTDMDGVDLIRKIRAIRPGTIVLATSANRDRSILLKSLNAAHQFIPKPINPNELARIIENSLGLRQVLNDEALHTKIASVGILPAAPDTYIRLVQMIESDDVSVRRIADLIKSDVGISAKLLHMANSAFFGLPARVENLLHAVNLLGLDTIKSLVLAAEVFGRFQDPHIPGFTIEGIYIRSMAVGARAKHLASALGLTRQHAEDALTAGLLHEIGLLIMLEKLRAELKVASMQAEQESIPLYEAELRLFGVTHAEIGAHLLSVWGLPYPIVEAVAYHYRPSSVPVPTMNALTAVHMAFALVTDDRVCNCRKGNVLDNDYRDRLHLSGKMNHIQRLCPAGAA